MVIQCSHCHRQSNLNPAMEPQRTVGCPHCKMKTGVPWDVRTEWTQRHEKFSASVESGVCPWCDQKVPLMAYYCGSCGRQIRVHATPQPERSET